MRQTALAVALLAIALAQVTVAPLFPVAAAIPDVVLVTLIALAFFSGPTPVMIALPLVALVLGFESSRQPGLMLLAYLPLLPIALFFEESNLPLNGLAQFNLAGALTGVWARSVLAFGALTAGAAFDLSTFLFQLLLPGLLLDVVLLTVVFIPIRIMGGQLKTLTLHGGRW